MKTLKHLGIVAGIAFIMAMYFWAADSLNEGIPAYYELHNILVEIAFATGAVFVVYSSIYFFLRLVFYLSRNKKVSKKNETA
ncbi:MAG: hypothetical protein K9I68_02510 [Bacteroidales bacterium]|nr:hypothetical protein [Bacteroidales bacterium]MCF8337265.1 hypothetical protein [Bacteroidales bacterium]